MGKLITAHDPTTSREKKSENKFDNKPESSAQLMELLEKSSEPTQAESSAREMINSNKYVVIDNTSLRSLSNGPLTPSRQS